MRRGVENKEKVKEHLSRSSSASKVNLWLRYRSGKTLRQLSAEFGLSIATLAKYIREAGGTLRSRGARPGSKRKNVKPVSVEKSFRTDRKYLK